MNYKDEELKLVDYQLIITGAVAIIVILSLVLGYNLHLKLNGQKPFLNDKEAGDISKFIKVVGLLAAIAAIYVSYKSVGVARDKHENLTDAYLEVAASALALFSAILVLIVVFKNDSDSLLDILNSEV